MRCLSATIRPVHPRIAHLCDDLTEVTHQGNAAKRSPAAPEIPAIAETVPGYDVYGWWALLVQAKTPSEIVAKIHSDAVAESKGTKRLTPRS